MYTQNFSRSAAAENMPSLELLLSDTSDAERTGSSTYNVLRALLLSPSDASSGRGEEDAHM